MDIKTVICILLTILIIWLLFCRHYKHGTNNKVIFDVITYRLSIFFSCLMSKHFENSVGIPTYNQERLMQLIRNFNDIQELSINNYNSETAYTVNKKAIRICLENRVFPHKIYNMNTIMFVVLHELTHVANDTWHHDKYFWKLFKYILMEAVSCNVYKPVNYAVNPEKYCNTVITYNPLFDDTV